MSDVNCTVEKITISIHIDNQGAIALIWNPQYHAQTKHIDIQHHYIRELLEAKQITLKYCLTAEMPVDITTKALPRIKHEKFMRMIGMHLEWTIQQDGFDNG